MNEPKLLNTTIFDGDLLGSQSTNLNPNGAGVNLTHPSASVVIIVAPDVLFIPYIIFIPLLPQNNVGNITVTITNPDGSISFQIVSQDGTNKVTGFPVTQLQSGTMITITLWALDNLPLQGVTVSVIGCFESKVITTQLVSEKTESTSVYTGSSVITTGSSTSGQSETTLIMTTAYTGGNGSSTMETTMTPVPSESKHIKRGHPMYFILFALIFLRQVQPNRFLVHQLLWPPP